MLNFVTLNIDSFQILIEESLSLKYERISNYTISSPVYRSIFKSLGSGDKSLSIKQYLKFIEELVSHNELKISSEKINLLLDYRKLVTLKETFNDSSVDIKEISINLETYMFMKSSRLIPSI